MRWAIANARTFAQLDPHHSRSHPSLWETSNRVRPRAALRMALDRLLVESHLSGGGGEYLHSAMQDWRAGWRRDVARRQLAAPFIPAASSAPRVSAISALPMPRDRPQGALLRAPQLGPSWALLRSPRGQVRSRILAASPVSTADRSAAAHSRDDDDDDADDFPWAAPGGVPKIPVIPTVLWNQPRPQIPWFDMNDMMDMCPVRGVVSFVAGGVLGVFMGVLIGSWQLGGPTGDAGLSDPTKLTTRQALKEMGDMMASRARSWGRNFAVVGGIYSTIECFIERGRGSHDVKNPVLSGCLTGGLLAAKQGPVAILGGCAGFAAFSLAVEHLMNSGRMPIG